MPLFDECIHAFRMPNFFENISTAAVFYSSVAVVLNPELKVERVEPDSDAVSHFLSPVFFYALHERHFRENLGTALALVADSKADK